MRGIKKILSGGQSGVDRAALDFARETGLPYGGWCPKGRKASDGRIAACYELAETPLPKYEQRTEWNARDADATVIFTDSLPLTGGTRFTEVIAKKLAKPCLVLVQGEISTASAKLVEFLRDHHVKILNVAGPRLSKAPHLPNFVRAVLAETLAP
jgi:hypothetical protein